MIMNSTSVQIQGFLAGFLISVHGYGHNLLTALRNYVNSTSKCWRALIKRDATSIALKWTWEVVVSFSDSQSQVLCTVISWTSRLPILIQQIYTLFIPPFGVSVCLLYLQDILVIGAIVVTCLKGSFPSFSALYPFHKQLYHSCHSEW